MQEIKRVSTAFETLSRLRMEAYAAVLLAVAVGLGALLAPTAGVGNLWAVAVLAIVAAVAERGSVRLSSSIEESISLLPTLFAAVVFGPFAAMVVGAASMLGDLKDPDRPLLKWTVYTSTRSIIGAAVGGVAVGVRSLGLEGFTAVAAATAAGALTAEMLGVAFVALTLRLRGKDRLGEVIRSHLPLLVASVPLYAPLVALLAVAYETLSPWTLVLFFVPALAAQRSFVMYQEQRRLAEDLTAANEQLERANLSFATALVATLDARDQYTAGHSAAVAVYARDIAARMGLSDEQQRLAHLCGLVHDIGKIGLAAGLLEKPGPLTLEERRQMEEHSAIGERILGKVEDYAEVAKVVRHHHERVDGHGYPDGLVGESIPLLARIIGVADAYNAMTSDRPYRDAMPSRVARLRLAQAVETQFDTTVVAAFEAILAAGSESYRSGSEAMFALEMRDAETAVRIAANAA